MSRSRPSSGRSRLICTAVCFVEVDLLRQVQPRLLIQFSQGFSLLLEDAAAVPLAADPLHSAAARDAPFVFTNKR
jgi:hypothetical protein